MSTRRDTLAFLGLVDDDSLALSTERMVQVQEQDNGTPGPRIGQDWSKQRACDALRRLIDGIEADRVEVLSVEVYSRLAPNEILTQTFSIEFNLPEAFEEP